MDVKDEPECVFPEEDHPSDAEIWLQDGVVVPMRVGSSGLTAGFSPDEARRLGLTL